VPLKSLKERQSCVELGRVDHVEQVGEVLEHRVHFGTGVLGLQFGSGGQAGRRGIRWIVEIDELGAECGGCLDLRRDVGRDELDLIGVDVELKLGGAGIAVDLTNAPDLDAAHLDLGLRFHDQARAFGLQRDGDIGLEGAGEESSGDPEEDDDDQDEDDGPPIVGDSAFAGAGVHG
jgi:hypothetical protein